MSTAPHPESGYMITEDEQFGVVRVSRVLSLMEDLLLMQDRRQDEFCIDPAGLQSLLGMLQRTLDPLLTATHGASWRFVASFEPPPLALLVDAVRAAGGQVDPAQAETTLAALQGRAGFRPVAEALRSIIRREQAEAWSD